MGKYIQEKTTNRYTVFWETGIPARKNPGSPEPRAKEKANADMKREIIGKEEQAAQKSAELSEAEATLSATTEQLRSEVNNSL